MPAGAWIIGGFAVLLAGGRISRALLANPGGDVERGLVWYAFRLYARVFHRVRLEGGEHIPRTSNPGALIVVSNHTSGVDPILIQAVCPFEPRWMMASEMRHPAAEFLWRFGRVIFVERGGRAVASAREAIRHLEGGGVLGVFPEGGIERPARTILPFLGGVGLIIKKTGAPVLPFVIDGTPIAEPAWATLYRMSRSRVRVMVPIDYAGTSMSAAEITEDLRRRYMEWTGWPAAPLPPQDRGGPG